MEWDTPGPIAATWRGAPKRLTGDTGAAEIWVRPARRYARADLLRHVVALDVLECLGLPSRSPPTAPAQPDPEYPEPAPYDW